MKRTKPRGHSARRGNSPSPYNKYNKKPTEYSCDPSGRLAGGDLKTKANDKLTNKYA